MQKSLTIHYEQLPLEELAERDQALVRQAQRAALSAHNPYSHFAVGAAARLGDGSVVCGSNQENAAYPSGLCAERVALFAAGAQHPDQPVEALAVTAAPCGACRQVMAECERRSGREMRVLVVCEQGEICIFHGTESLMPFGFEL